MVTYCEDWHDDRPGTDASSIPKGSCCTGSGHRRTVYSSACTAETERSLEVPFVGDDQMDGNLVECQMTSHPFGLNSSPFCENFVVCRTAIDCVHDYEEYVSEGVRDNLYVDDCLVSPLNVHAAKVFAGQIGALLGNADFPLRKWMRCHKEALEILPKSELARRTSEIRISKWVPEKPWVWNGMPRRICAK